jgi:hypothetical protein
METELRSSRLFLKDRTPQKDYCGTVAASSHNARQWRSCGYASCARSCHSPGCESLAGMGINSILAKHPVSYLTHAPTFGEGFMGPNWQPKMSGHTVCAPWTGRYEGFRYQRFLQFLNPNANIYTLFSNTLMKP